MGWSGQAFKLYDTPRPVWVVACKRCRADIRLADGAAPHPEDNLVATCPDCHEKRRYLTTEVYRGVPTAPLPRTLKEDPVRPSQVVVNFISRDGLWVQYLAPDCKTVISPYVYVRTPKLLRKTFMYLGTTRTELEHFDLAMRSWGQGSAWVTLMAGRPNLLRIRSEHLPVR